MSKVIVVTGAGRGLRTVNEQGTKLVNTTSPPSPRSLGTVGPPTDKTLRRTDIYSAHNRHFLLESHLDVVAGYLRGFLGRVLE
ncbi:hypothetical protein [Streptomyces roseus]|uniref:hypothetical protein n=1 Tax=Streptomyces roseus TaxID=66430 RepID=UPI000A46E757|nr:hypothetical protein [Streptomyces roseus]